MFSIELSKFRTKKTKFCTKFLTFKMAKVQVFAISYVKHAKNFGNTVFTRFVARAFIFFNQMYYRALIQARALVIFKVKLYTKTIVEDKYFTTLILFPCQFIHVKRKLFAP